MTLRSRFLLILVITFAALVVALPQKISIHQEFLKQPINIEWQKPPLGIHLGNFLNYDVPQNLKQGLDLAGGMEVTLKLDMSEISSTDRATALTAAREVIARRVDLFGVAEPQIYSLVSGDDYRLVVQLPGLDDPSRALELIGSTAQLDFRAPIVETASDSAAITSFSKTELSGKDLNSATVTFNNQTGDPVVSLKFSPEGREKFSQLTKDNIDKPIAIFLDDQMVTAPVVRAHITTGEAIIEGDFTTEDAKQLSIQLSAGALPVPLIVESQQTVTASLGQDSVKKSLSAGIFGLGLVVLFMCLVYGKLGIFASLGLAVYALLNLALYKLIPVTLSLPGIAGFILSVGMAVDSNILIFERFKEELRDGKPSEVALESAFGRAWDSIKDANAATLITAFILFNPFSWSLLPTSGPVRGFALTLFLGIVTSLFTGIFVTRTLLRVFYKGPAPKKEI